MRRVLLISCVVVCLVVAAGVIAMRRYTAVFPDIAPGTYTGQLTAENTGRSVPWCVVRFEGEQSLAVAIGDATLPAQRVAPVDPSGSTRLPLIVGGSESRLRLTGKPSEEPGTFEGEYLNPISNKRGRWRLAKLSMQPSSAKLDHDVTTWFSIWREIERIEEEIQDAQQKADQQRASIDNLHRFVNEDGPLRKTADIRLGRADSELEAARAELQQRQSQLDRASRDFDLSQRISQEGRLVFLSRETIQRESRWIELSLRLLSPETSPGFDQALERAERVRALRREIREAREAAVQRSTGQRYKGESIETEHEKEFYGNLQ
jgi:hypothetical protein